MTRQISMTTRKELIAAIGDRYRTAPKADKAKILDEFSTLTGYHRKHAIRVLNGAGTESAVTPAAPRNRVYNEAVRQALIVLWEAGDRVCGKRLKVMIPIMVNAMERHGHLLLDAAIKDKLLLISAASIDRVLRKTREQIDGKGKRRSGVGSAIRRSIPVRTFADWGDPPPGCLEVDMVEHCGGVKHDGNFVHSLVLTDIASGWTECIAMPVRNQSLIVAGFAKAASELPFAMLGIDTDNDSAFMNQTVLDYCKDNGLVQTRSRAYKKNDNAWVEQKNGAIVRRLVGYGKLSGLRATYDLGQMYAASRLYINFFQPSFKLKSKARDGARVQKKYHAPMTPCDRLLALPNVTDASKAALREQFEALDPVLLLQTIRDGQRRLAELTKEPSDEPASAPGKADVATFLHSLSTAWKDGEVRPTHRKQPGATRWWKTRADPFEHAWSIVEQWLMTEPTVSAKELLERLAAVLPDAYAGTSQLRTLQRRVQRWRAEQAKNMILGSLELAKLRA
ncbi:transposase family protein [Undibacterium arcticum]|uniref:Transposase family protein n=1 Tax=Undibacterium arcticum TaxID=1762892 RepID=A0ABV7F7P6_9BURK